MFDKFISNLEKIKSIDKNDQLNDKEKIFIDLIEKFNSYIVCKGENKLFEKINN
jgi:hypothetical protein